jgi:hypothetical protein
VVRAAEFCQLFVLEFHDLRREIAFAVVPEGVDRQDLHVDGLRIHRGEPLTEFDKGLLRPVFRAGLKPWPLLTQERTGFVEITVRVHVDGLDLLASDRDGQFVPRRLLGARAVQDTAAAKEDAGCSHSGASFDKITASRHDDLLHGSCFLNSLAAKANPRITNSPVMQAPPKRRQILSLPALFA